MNKPSILVAGKRKPSPSSLTEFSNYNSEWETIEVATAEEAIEQFHRLDFEMVILADGLSGEEEKKLSRIFKVQNPDIIIMKYHENDKSSLSGEILKTLNTLKKAKTPAFTIVDDALKNEGLNINVQ
jgi:hypothetical protein